MSARVEDLVERQLDSVFRRFAGRLNS